MDRRTGEDIHLKEQRQAHENQTELLARKTVENQLLLTNCLSLRRTLRKPAYRDFMFLIGCSYMPDDLLNDEQGGSGGSGDEKRDEKSVEQMRQRKSAMVHARRTFREEILPKLEARIMDQAKNLRWTMYVAEGDTIEDIAERETQIQKLFTRGKLE